MAADPCSAVLSDGVAKEQVVSALSTVEEVEQVAFELFVQIHSFLIIVQILENG